VKDTLRFFEIAKPNPTISDAQTQLGVHLEEIVEMLDDGLGFNNDLTYELDVWATRLKKNEVLDFDEDMDRKSLLDSLTDQYVTLIGTARALGMDIESAVKEVEASNLSKFIHVGDKELSPYERMTFDSQSVQIEDAGRYKGVHWKRVSEYIVFYDENGKILKSPSTYFEPKLEAFI
jgi:hypothetical protein